MELNLIAQDVTQYGHDLYGGLALSRLLKELDKVDGLRWIRLMYAYPSRLTDELIDTMASLEHVVSYVDIPLQHSHPDVLRRMNRPGNGEQYLKLFEKLRKAMPGIAIRSAFIVGFPGESEEEFKHLAVFLREAKLDRVGTFIYSRESGTPSFDMPMQVSFKNKRLRQDVIMRQQQAISLAINESWVSKKIEVLVEGFEDGWSFGRSYRDAPEVDGLVYMKGRQPAGEIVTCKVERAEPYDLYGHKCR